MAKGINELIEIKRDVESGKERTASVREILRWFGAKRRGAVVVEKINKELQKLGLETEPDFETIWIDSTVNFVKKDDKIKSNKEEENNKIRESKNITFRNIHLVRMLKSANCGVASVKQDDSIEKAITKMMVNDYSQLAVMTTDTTLKGAISWKSIGMKMSQGNEVKTVSQAMISAEVVEDEDSLFSATPKVIENDYVFVRSKKDKRIKGIITSTDLSAQFMKLSEPFILLGKIEHQLRKLINEKIDIESIRNACFEGDLNRRKSVNDANDLTYGEYIRIIEDRDNWNKMGLILDRKEFLKVMESIRELRNDIMHFHPDIMEEGDFDVIRKFEKFLDEIEKVID